METKPLSWSDNPFRYGSRWKSDQEIPLTPDDLLDPELGDEIPQSNPHAEVVTTLFGLLNRYFAEDEDVVIFYDMKIIWGVPGLPNPSPDITVLRGLPKRAGREIYKVAEEGVLPCLIVEVVSFPDAAMYQNDHVKKLELYQGVGIQEYLVVDAPFLPEDHLTLTGYRLTSDRQYQRIKPDSRGCLYSETTSLFFAPSEDGSVVRVRDARTVEWLLTPSEERAAHKAAEERAAREAEARKAAEERTAREAEARKVAEERASSAAAEAARLRAEIERLKKSLK